MQHVVAMFGATLLVPTLTHFPVNTTLLFSGLGTIIFLLLTRNKVPSYLGSSFAFIGGEDEPVFQTTLDDLAKSSPGVGASPFSPVYS